MRTWAWLTATFLFLVSCDGGSPSTDASAEPARNADAALGDAPSDAGSDAVLSGQRDGGCHDGECVECSADHDCRESGRPFCRAKVCVSCALAEPLACATRSSAAPACAPEGRCVECTQDADCLDPARPTCNRGMNRCAACSTDAQCAAKPSMAVPGICLSGRCASEEETVFVEDRKGRCGPMGTTCTSRTPCCTPAAAIAQVTGLRRLVVLRGAVEGVEIDLRSDGALMIVGQGADAVIHPGTRPGVLLQAGELRMRNVTIDRSGREGIVARTGTVLRLEGVRVQNNEGGGILLDGASFEIVNTVVENNGPAIEGGSVSWGGVYVRAVPPAGSKRLERITVRDNQQVGLVCGGLVAGSGVLATGNTGGIDIAPACGVASCSVGTTGCGAELR